MGYVMYTADSKFFIHERNIPEALEKLKEIIFADMKEGEFKYDPSFALSVLDTKTLDEALAMVGFEVYYNVDGCIDNIFLEDSSGWAEYMLECIAEFVTEGSWILWHGEENEMWKGVFKKGSDGKIRYMTYNGIITFPEDPERKKQHYEFAHFNDPRKMMEVLEALSKASNVKSCDASYVMFDDGTIIMGEPDVNSGKNPDGIHAFARFFLTMVK